MAIGAQKKGRSPRARGLAGVAMSCLVAAMAASCASVKIEGDADFRVEGGDTYYWDFPLVSDPSGLGQPGLPWDDFSNAIESELSLLGVERAPRAEARWRLRLDLDVEVKYQNHDPYYSLYIAEKYEDGSVSLEWIDPSTGLTAWRSVSRHKLRDLERTMGGPVVHHWTPTGDPRDWHIDDVVTRILESVPIEATRDSGGD